MSKINKLENDHHQQTESGTVRMFVDPQDQGSDETRRRIGVENLGDLRDANEDESQHYGDKYGPELSDRQEKRKRKYFLLEKDDIDHHECLPRQLESAVTEKKPKPSHEERSQNKSSSLIASYRTQGANKLSTNTRHPHLMQRATACTPKQQEIIEDLVKPVEVKSSAASLGCRQYLYQDPYTLSAARCLPHQLSSTSYVRENLQELNTHSDRQSTPKFNVPHASIRQNLPSNRAEVSSPFLSAESSLNHRQNLIRPSSHHRASFHDRDLKSSDGPDSSSSSSSSVPQRPSLPNDRFNDASDGHETSTEQYINSLSYTSPFSRRESAYPRVVSHMTHDGMIHDGMIHGGRFHGGRFDPRNEFAPFEGMIPSSQHYMTTLPSFLTQIQQPTVIRMEIAHYFPHPYPPFYGPIEPFSPTIGFSSPLFSGFHQERKSPHHHPHPHHHQKRELPLMLSMEEDKFAISAYQTFLREQIEVFEATDHDATIAVKGRTKNVTKGQIGIRCRHCRGLPSNARQRASVYFPSSLIGMYQAAQNMANFHIVAQCSQMPQDIKDGFNCIISTKSIAGGGKSYWAEAAKALGLVDTPEGIRFIQSDDNGSQVQT